MDEWQRGDDDEWIRTVSVGLAVEYQWGGGHMK